MNESGVKVCKKCKRVLPSDYRHSYCEACRNQQVQVVKNLAKGAAALAGVVVAIATGGKIKPKKGS